MCSLSTSNQCFTDNISNDFFFTAVVNFHGCSVLTPTLERMSLHYLKKIWHFFIPFSLKLVMYFLSGNRIVVQLIFHWHKINNDQHLNNKKRRLISFGQLKITTYATGITLWTIKSWPNIFQHVNNLKLYYSYIICQVFRFLDDIYKI